MTPIPSPEAQIGPLAQRCIDNIERIVKARDGRISEPQRHMLAHCLRVPGTTTTLPVQRIDRLPQHEGDAS